MIETPRFNPWQVALAPPVFGHFGKFFDASEEHFARVHKEPSAGTLAMAVNLSAAERTLAHLDARRLLSRPAFHTRPHAPPWGKRYHKKAAGVAADGFAR